jgi:hypothetical protein
MEYRIYESPANGGQSIERTNEDGSLSYIPMNPANSDYQEYLAWVENPEAEDFTPNLPR